jgi:4-hydroxy-2-oxoheptanedioate aldolase
LTASFVTLNDMTSAEIAARAGYDLVVLDLEHGTITAQPADFVRAVETGGSNAWIRVPPEFLLQPWLDAGIAGVLFARCNSPELAHEMVAKASWPPVGWRGLAGSTRATSLGNLDTNRDRVAIGVIIEDEPGVDHATEILAVPGLDLVVIGLTDLAIDTSLRKQQTLESLTDELMAVTIKIASVATNNGVSVGIPVDHPLCRFDAEALSRIRPAVLLKGADIPILRSGLAAALSSLNEHAAAISPL